MEILVVLYVLVYGTRGQRSIEIDEIKPKKLEKSKMAEGERKGSGK